LAYRTCFGGSVTFSKPLKITTLLLNSRFAKKVAISDFKEQSEQYKFGTETFTNTYAYLECCWEAHELFKIITISNPCSARCPSAMVHPSEMYQLCLIAGLGGQGASQLEPSLLTQRELLLDVASQHNMVGVIVTAARDWADGRYSKTGCSLPFIFRVCTKGFHFAYSPPITKIAYKNFRNCLRTKILKFCYLEILHF
jgi:hypothetical protein